MKRMISSHSDSPYKLPKGWRWVQLGQVCEVIMGQSPPSKTYNAEKKGLPFFQGKADFGELYPTPRVWCSSPQKIAQPGDILISVRAPIGPTNLANVTCCIGRGLAALRATPAIEQKWLLYYLRSIEKYLSDRGSGSTFSAITKRQLKELLIPLPPLPEQRRIVARIEELMERVREAKRLREEAKKDADRLMQAALAEVFPRPGQELPPGWKWVKLEEVARPVNGFGFPKKFQGHKDLPYPFIKVSDFNRPGNETLITHAENYVDDKILSRIDARVYPAETIIFPKIGGAIATNKKRMLATPASFDNNIMGLIPTDNISGNYLLYFMQSVDLRTLSQIGPVPSIRQSTINLQLPLPPLPEQRCIVAYLDQIQARVTALKKAQESTEAELHRLEQTILDKAFRGEL